MQVSQLRERVTPLRAGKATVSSADYESVNKVCSPLILHLDCRVTLLC